MNVPKRCAASKNNAKYNGKLKEPSTKQGTDEKITEADVANIPIIKQSDNSKLLPKYSAILAKTGDDGVAMEDLDHLQQDLEKLLSINAVRIRHLLAEIGEIDRNDNGHNRKAFDKTSLKRKRNDDTRKFKDLKNGMRVVKKQSGLPVNKFVVDHHLQEVPKVTLPKNDNSDKFWTSIEPYCANVNKDDVAFLDSLIQEFSKEISVKIPDIGEHYAEGWSDEVINEEQHLGKTPTKKVSGIPEIKRNGLQAMVESFSTPQTQMLIEEKMLKVLPKGKYNGGTRPIKMKAFDIFKANNNQKLGVCLDKKLKDELVHQGLLSAEDVAKYAPDDEILEEIRKCQEELLAINNYNVQELNKLKSIVVNDLHSNEVREQLEKVDKQILDLYNKILVARKTAQQQEGDEFDKILFNEQITKEFELQADSLLKQQISLNNESLGANDVSLLH